MQKNIGKHGFNKFFPKKSLFDREEVLYLRLFINNY